MPVPKEKSVELAEELNRLYTSDTKLLPCKLQSLRRKVEELVATDFASAQMYYGMVAGLTGDKDEVVSRYQQVLKLTNSFVAHINFAAAFVKCSDILPAYEAVLRAREFVDPLHPGHLVNMLKASYAVGAFLVGLDTVEKMRRLKLNNPQVQVLENDMQDIKSLGLSEPAVVRLFALVHNWARKKGVRVCFESAELSEAEGDVFRCVVFKVLSKKTPEQLGRYTFELCGELAVANDSDFEDVVINLVASGA